MCEFHLQRCQQQVCGTCVCHSLYHGETMLEELPGCFLPSINPSETGSPTVSVFKETKPHKSGTVWTQEFIAVVASQQWPPLFYIPHNTGPKKLTPLLLECCQAHGSHRPSGGCRNESRTWVSRNCAMTGLSFLEGEDPASPAEDEKPRVEWKRSRGKPRLPGLPTVAEQWEHFTDQPDKSPPSHVYKKWGMPVFLCASLWFP